MSSDLEIYIVVGGAAFFLATGCARALCVSARAASIYLRVPVAALSL